MAEELNLDAERGFQREPGFMIDEVVGDIHTTIVRCHSARHPQVKERVLMLMPDGKLRVHDYVAIRRCHGKQIVCDLWTGALVGRDRIIEFAKRMFQKLEKSAIAKLISKL